MLRKLRELRHASLCVSDAQLAYLGNNSPNLVSPPLQTSQLPDFRSRKCLMLQHISGSIASNLTLVPIPSISLPPKLKLTVPPLSARGAGIAKRAVTGPNVVAAIHCCQKFVVFTHMVDCMHG
jgi:hypothetical protein